MNFTTRDSDNDVWPGNCAATDITQPYGGWWHHSCWDVNPNNFYNHKKYGIYLNGEWIPTPPLFIEMKIRPYKCNI